MKKSKLAEDLKQELNNQMQLQQEKESSLILNVKNKLDWNGDGYLTKDDVIDLLFDYVDTNEDNKISLWEYIACVYRIIRIVKKLKK